MKEWKINNPEYMVSYKKQYYQENKEQLIEYNAIWAKNNPEKIREYSCTYIQRHLDRHAERQRRRYAQKKNNGYERVNYKAIYKRDNYTCQICHKENLKRPDITIDHIIPITKGGPHIPDNLQVACRACNIKKGNRI